MLNAQCDTDEYSNNITPKVLQFVIVLMACRCWKKAMVTARRPTVNIKRNELLTFRTKRRQNMYVLKLKILFFG